MSVLVVRHSRHLLLRFRVPFPFSMEGLDWIWLWSREWNKTFVVEVAWDADDEVNATVTTGLSLSGRVAANGAAQHHLSGTLGLTTTPLTYWCDSGV
jgi:hypothetical protein